MKHPLTPLPHPHTMILQLRFVFSGDVLVYYHDTWVDDNESGVHGFNSISAF